MQGKQGAQRDGTPRRRSARIARNAQIGAETLENWLPRSCLVYLTDTRYLPLTLTSVLTAARSIPASMDVIIYLDEVPQNISKEAATFLIDWGIKASLRDFDIGALFQNTSRIPLWRDGISRAGFARLGLCGAPEGYDTHIILDGDTLVGGDLRELASTRPAGIAAVSSGHPETSWSYLYKDRAMPVARDYFNAGLMVLNADMWRREAIEDRCMALANDHSLDAKLHRPMRDQEILNIVFGDTFQRLNDNWNFKRERSWDYSMDMPLIAHFAGKAHPWDPRDMRALPVFRQIYSEAFSRMPKAMQPAIDTLMLTDKNLKSAVRFKPALGRWNPRHRIAWNPAQEPLLSHWGSLLPWNR